MWPCFLICWKILMNYYGMVGRIIVNYRLLHMCSPSSRIVGWVRPIMMNYQMGEKYFYLKKTCWKWTSILLSPWWNPSVYDIKKLTCALIFVCCTTLKMLSWPSAWYVSIPVTNPELALERLVAYKKLKYFPITPRLQKLFMSPITAEHMTSHQSRDVVDDWWCILLTEKHENTLTVCIITFHLNQGTCVFDCVQMDSTHSGHLLLLILVSWSYSWFTTCHRKMTCCWPPIVFF